MADSQMMGQAAGPLKSSGAQLKDMLQKTGRSLKDFHVADKLELLQAITDQIKLSISHGQKMLLTLSKLNSFLSHEGMSAGEDAKSTIQQLLELRQSQLARVGGYVAPRSSQEVSEEMQWLVVIPDQKVSDCFAQGGAEGDHGSPDPNQESPGLASPHVGKMIVEPAKAESASDACPSKALGSDQACATAQITAEPQSASIQTPSGEQASTPATSTESQVCSIKTSGSDLKTMLAKTGRDLKSLVAGTEKLDIVNMITETVKEKILSRQRMELKLADLNSFLKLEGLSQGDDAKSTVELLLELRSRVISHLGRYVAAPRTGPADSQIPNDSSFKLEMALIPSETVHDCFAAEAGTGNLAAELSQTNSGARKRSRDSDDDAEITRSEAPPASIPRLESDGDDMEVQKSCAASIGDVIDVPKSHAASNGDIVDVPKSCAASDGDHMDVQKSVAGSDLTSALSPELRELLFTVSDAWPALDGLLVAPESQAESAEATENISGNKDEALQEIERILATKDIGKILGAGSVEDQKQMFQRIARLLHPDKGYVDAGDKRANLAFRLALAAKHQIEGAKSD